MRLQIFSPYICEWKRRGNKSIFTSPNQFMKFLSPHDTIVIWECYMGKLRSKSEGLDKCYKKDAIEKDCNYKAIVK